MSRTSCPIQAKTFDMEFPMPVIIHPPGTPLEPDHPFAKVCILFAPRLRSPSMTKRATGQRNDVELPKSNEDEFGFFKRRLYDDIAISIKYPLVPQPVPDLEDIAFEILRERYKGR